MIWSVINFVIFVGVLFFVLRKPVREFWAGRSHGIRFEIEESEKLKRQAGKRHEELQKRFSRIEAEAKGLIQSLELEGEMEKKRLIEESERLSRRLLEEGERIAAQEVRKAVEILKTQTVALSIEMAERLVKERVDENDQRRLSEKYLAELERSPA